MNISPFGTLGASVSLQRNVQNTQQNISRLSDEISSGEVADVNAALRGDLGPLSNIESELKRLAAFDVMANERSLQLEAQQASISRLRSLSDTAASFLLVPNSENREFNLVSGLQSLEGFEAAVSSLNTQIGGRSVFSGVETTRPALASASDVLSSIEAEITLAGAATAEDVEAVVDAWFSDAGQYSTDAYVGGPAASSNLQISDTEFSSPLATAERQEVREFLSALTLGALLGKGLFTNNIVEQSQLARLAGERLLGANSTLVDLQAMIGIQEEKIQLAKTENLAKRNALAEVQAELIQIDPFEAALSLQSAQVQLESIFAITGRLSQISLVNYI